MTIGLPVVSIAVEAAALMRSLLAARLLQRWNFDP